ncbi:MAG: glycosyltransferase family 4 protein [Candidatus Omnitrophica bacterium]|nr:glycosyltransferase family 4 protein [Candidatus Omnitrophota bacterium]
MFAGSMRILVLENEMSSKRGGQELSLLDVCQGLARRGHEIILLYRRTGDLEEAYRSFCRLLRRVEYYSIDREKFFSSVFSFLVSLGRTRRIKPDLVYANQYLDSLFAGFLARSLGVPFVCHLRLPPPDSLCGQYRMGMRRASKLIAISEQTRRDWAERGFSPDEIEVVHNGIDLDRFPLPQSGGNFRKRFGISSGAFLVTYAGRLHPVKGVEVLLRAFSRLPGEGGKRLVLAGKAAELKDKDGTDRDYRRELEALANDLGMGGEIIWIEHWEDVQSLFGDSDVVVLPSLWSEPFGRVLIEAMACGTPAVGSRIGGIPEILSGEFASFCFERGSVEALAAVLQGLVGWRKRDPCLSGRCREHVMRNFPVEKMVDGVERTLRESLQYYSSSGCR